MPPNPAPMTIASKSASVLDFLARLFMVFSVVTRGDGKFHDYVRMGRDRSCRGLELIKGSCTKRRFGRVPSLLQGSIRTARGSQIVFEELLQERSSPPVILPWHEVSRNR